MFIGIGITCLAGVFAVVGYGRRVERAYRVWSAPESPGDHKADASVTSLRPVAPIRR